MYSVTQAFKDTIYSDVRTVYGKVTFDLSPVNIETDTPTITANNEFAVSQKSQLTDNLRSQTYKLATWEIDRVLLDGSFTFPSATSSEWREVGYVSNTVSTANEDLLSTLNSTMPLGILNGTSYPTVTMVYNNSYTTNGVTLTFNPLENEYATDFVITIKDASDATIYTETVTGNTNVQYQLVRTLTGFKKVIVELRKWSKPYRRARMVEVDPGIVLTYENNKLIRFNLSEEMDTITSTLVIPEFEFTVDNTDKAFDILNPTGIYSYLQQRQRIFPEVGLDLNYRTEWVPLGFYYLSEWRSDVGSQTATFRGRSKIDLLDLTNYSQSTSSATNLYDVAVAILTAAGVTGYSIDSALSSIGTNGLIAQCTCREALQQVAIAGRANVFITRGDVLTIQQTRASTSSNTLTYGVLIDKPQIQQFKQVQTVNVSYYTNLTTLGGTSTITDSTVTNGEVITLTNNTLINNATVASAVASWLQSRRNERNLFTFETRGNPAIELNDLNTIQNDYVSNQLLYIHKIDMNYEGSLKMNFEGRGV